MSQRPAHQLFRHELYRLSRQRFVQRDATAQAELNLRRVIRGCNGSCSYEWAVETYPDLVPVMLEDGRLVLVGSRLALAQREVA